MHHLQLFPQMGPDPVPELHRGVELIIHSKELMQNQKVEVDEIFTAKH